MEASKELEKFREQWRNELKGQKSAPEAESGKSKTLENCEKEKRVEGGCSWPDLEGSKSKPNAYQPFLLAEDLLKQSGTDNFQQSYREQPSRKRQFSSTACSSGSLNQSASFSEDGSLIESQDSKRSKPDSSADESFLDIFLQDLVSLTYLLILL